MVYQLKHLLMELLVSIVKFNVGAARLASALLFQPSNINTRTEYLIIPIKQGILVVSSLRTCRPHPLTKVNNKQNLNTILIIDENSRDCCLWNMSPENKSMLKVNNRNT